jgi:SAM-dependent methyltransferase
LPTNFSVCEIGNQTFVGEKFKSVKEWYEHLGASSYLALDTNTKLDAIICDLNYDVIDQLGDEQFDLITNNGTSEHLFNQAMVFENIHNLCKQDGIMLHILPLFVWLNHGFFNYNPILFRDLARVNGYEILFYHIANRWGDGEEITDFDELFKEKNPDVLFEIIKKCYTIAPMHKDVFNIVCLKKKSAEQFKMPLQGKYVKDVEGNLKST